jgi:hypothetical protein
MNELWPWLRLQSPARPAALCATGGVLKFRGDILVRPRSSPGAMPGMPVRMHPGVGGARLGRRRRFHPHLDQTELALCFLT